MAFENRHMHHRTCRNCGEVGPAHEKEKAFPEDGPAGSWHHEYRCPDDSGRRFQP